MSNAELIEKCKNNDRKSQLKLYNLYCEGMYVVAQRYIQDAMEAEDALQDAFIKAFKNLHQFKGEVSFGAWLKRIVINMCFDFLKKKKLEIVAKDVYEMPIADEDNWEVPDDTRAEQVRNAIASMPLKYKNVVQLFLLEGYDHHEISNILEVSEVASRTLLFRGKKMIQDQLKQQVYGTRS